jgi:hypothetical protein
MAGVLKTGADRQAQCWEAETAIHTSVPLANGSVIYCNPTDLDEVGPVSLLFRNPLADCR